MPLYSVSSGNVLLKPWLIRKDVGGWLSWPNAKKQRPLQLLKEEKPDEKRKLEKCHHSCNDTIVELLGEPTWSAPILHTRMVCQALVLDCVFDRRVSLHFWQTNILSNCPGRLSCWHVNRRIVWRFSTESAATLSTLWMAYSDAGLPFVLSGWTLVTTQIRSWSIRSKRKTDTVINVF